MTRLTLTGSRLLDPPQYRFPGAGSAVGVGRARFGSNPKHSVRGAVRRAAGRMKRLLETVTGIIAVARLRRIEREMMIHGFHQDWLRIDDDHFTAIEP